ncbi:MAG TPA: peptidoglycan DD-metalloendopeptidase family protein [Methylococcus sp.]|nr:peptidoglycan DD-metalloendopeptidase family protein [Methylococcus sp.]
METCWAGTEQDPTVERLEAVRGEIGSVEKEIEAIEAKRGSVSAELRRIEQRYGEVIRSLKELDEKAQAQAKRVSELHARLSELQQTVLRHHHALGVVARSAYALGDRQWLKLVLSIDEPTRLSRLMAYHAYLNRDRHARLKEIEADIVRVQDLQNESLAETGRLESLRERMSRERAELDELTQQRRSVLAKLRLERQDKDMEMARLRQSEQHLEQLLSSLRAIDASPAVVPERRAFAELRGHLHWPTQGEVVEQFGTSRMSGRWDGVVIRAPEGAPVKAVSGGRVVFSDWLRGYGLLTIIDHGDGYMTLYAFNQSVYKKVGDWVESGEVIASVGSSGGRWEPGLYFGIREKGRPIDPSLWCN